MSTIIALSFSNVSFALPNLVFILTSPLLSLYITIMPPKLEGVNTEGLADPTVQPPDAQMLEQATIGSLRSGQHLDINGNLISKWNVVRNHLCRVLTTFKPIQISRTQHDLAWSARSTPSGPSRKPLTMATRGGAQ